MISLIPKSIFLVSLLALSLGKVCGQQQLSDSTIRLGMLQLSYQGLLPSADMGDRFGYLSTLGLEGGYKFANNFYLTSGFHVLFSDRVRETDMLDGISTPSGFLVSDDGTLTDVQFQGRGWSIPVTAGKIFPIIPLHNPNSGLFLELGGQFIQHRVFFRTPGGKVAAISDDYQKGYDRLTNGWGLRQAIGYRFFANNGNVNFAIGLTFSQHFTRNRRGINIDTGLPDDGQRRDLLTGFCFSWTYPLYRRAPSKVYYN